MWKARSTRPSIPPTNDTTILSSSFVDTAILTQYPELADVPGPSLTAPTKGIPTKTYPATARHLSVLARGDLRPGPADSLWVGPGVRSRVAGWPSVADGGDSAGTGGGV